MNYLFKTFALCHETTDNSSTDGFLFSMNQLKVPSVLFDCLLIQDILLLICQTKSNLENNPKSFKYLLSSGIPHLWQKKKKKLKAEEQNAQCGTLFWLLSTYCSIRLLPFSLLPCCSASLVGGCCLMTVSVCSSHGSPACTDLEGVGTLNIAAEKTLNCM